MLAPDQDQAGVGERLELERHSAERDVGHGRMDVPGGDFAIPDQAQDLAAAGGRDGGENGRAEHEA